MSIPAEDLVPVEWEKHVYRAVVSPGPERWVVEVPDMGVLTTARRIDQAAEEAEKAICLGPVQPEWGFHVEIDLANPYVPDEELSRAVICDIDGTLAHSNHRGPFEFDKVETDDLDEPVSRFLDLCYGSDVVILLSGRQEEYRPHTERWLEKHQVAYDELYMRAKGDRRSDDLVKMGLFDAHIRSQYHATLMLDDRNRCVYLWRKLGLPCWQVAFGDF